MALAATHIVVEYGEGTFIQRVLKSPDISYITNLANLGSGPKLSATVMVADINYNQTKQKLGEIRVFLSPDLRLVIQSITGFKIVRVRSILLKS